MPMTPTLKAEILATHNNFKNKIAGGTYPGVALPTGARMQTFEWNSQLEYLAELNCKSCNFAHDEIDQMFVEKLNVFEV